MKYISTHLRWLILLSAFSFGTSFLLAQDEPEDPDSPTEGGEPVEGGDRDDDQGIDDRDDDQGIDDRDDDQGIDDRDDD
ncbi:MAG: hypothetical protein HOK49_01975, partial [Opitutae bacterium]|nr:hypothetical protein [Opitutae bacterium]